MTSRRDLLKYLGFSGVFAPMLARAADAGLRSHRLETGARSADPSARGTHRTLIPFRLYGKTGRIAVTYGVTVDPAAVGFDVIPNLGVNDMLCRGYPTVHALIERYAGTGYRRLCGWIQVVSDEYYRTGDGDAAPAERSVSVDKLPSMQHADMPFADFGTPSEFFDAPCGNLNGYARLRWTAHSFLTTVPIRSRDENIRRLAGFRWGYISHDISARRAVRPLPLAATGARAWNDLLPVLRKTFPNWRFAADT